jgi:hypothetical protein
MASICKKNIDINFKLWYKRIVIQKYVWLKSYQTKEKTMAKTKAFWGMLVAALVFGISIVGCDNGLTLLSDTIWDSGIYSYHFYSDGRGERLAGYLNISVAYTYSISGNNVTIVWEGFSDSVTTGVISGDTMTLTDPTGETTILQKRS